jgi:putative spermidine/putrescine transport system permease protein
MAQVDEEVIESAQDLGANGFQTFWHVLVPLSLPGVAIGALFIIVMTLGEYATNAIIGGNMYPMIGNNIMVRNLSAQWAPASAYSIILMIITMICVIILFRFINIRKRLR